MIKKIIPVEFEFKIPHYLNKDEVVGKKIRIKQHLIMDTILHRSTTAIIEELIYGNNETELFAIRVRYANGVTRNENPKEFKLKLISILQ